jgi:hypothetical protein
MNAESVSEKARRRKGPTRPAVALVFNRPYTVRTLITPVEFLYLSFDGRSRRFILGRVIDHEDFVVFFIEVNLFVALNSFFGIFNRINFMYGDWIIFNDIPVVPAT